jgi:hypothetical protein
MKKRNKVTKRKDNRAVITAEMKKEASAKLLDEQRSRKKIKQFRKMLKRNNEEYLATILDTDRKLK